MPLSDKPRHSKHSSSHAHRGNKNEDRSEVPMAVPPPADDNATQFERGNAESGFEREFVEKRQAVRQTSEVQPSFNVQGGEVVGQLPGAGSTVIVQRHEVEGPILHEKHVEQPIIHEQHLERKIVHEHHVDQPVIHERHIEQPVIHEHHIEKPVIHEKHIEKPIIHEKHIERPIIHEKHIEKPVVHERHVDRPIVHERHIDRPIIHEKHIEKPIVHERHIDRPIVHEKHIEKPVIHERHIEKPIIHEKHIERKIVHEKHVVQPVLHEVHVNEKIVHDHEVAPPVVEREYARGTREVERDDTQAEPIYHRTEVHAEPIVYQEGREQMAPEMATENREYQRNENREYQNQGTFTCELKFQAYRPEERGERQERRRERRERRTEKEYEREKENEHDVRDTEKFSSAAASSFPSTFQSRDTTSNFVEQPEVLIEHEQLEAEVIVEYEQAPPTIVREGAPPMLSPDTAFEGSVLLPGEVQAKGDFKKYERQEQRPYASEFRGNSEYGRQNAHQQPTRFVMRGAGSGYETDSSSSVSSSTRESDISSDLGRSGMARRDEISFRQEDRVPQQQQDTTITPNPDQQQVEHEMNLAREQGVTVDQKRAKPKRDPSDQSYRDAELEAELRRDKDLIDNTNRFKKRGSQSSSSDSSEGRGGRAANANFNREGQHSDVQVPGQVMNDNQSASFGSMEGSTENLRADESGSGMERHRHHRHHHHHHHHRGEDGVERRHHHHHHHRHREGEGSSGALQSSSNSGLNESSRSSSLKQSNAPPNTDQQPINNNNTPAPTLGNATNQDANQQNKQKDDLDVPKSPRVDMFGNVKGGANPPKNDANEGKEGNRKPGENSIPKDTVEQGQRTSPRNDEKLGTDQPEKKDDLNTTGAGAGGNINVSPKPTNDGHGQDKEEKQENADIKIPPTRPGMGVMPPLPRQELHKPEGAMVADPMAKNKDAKPVAGAPAGASAGVPPSGSQETLPSSGSGDVDKHKHGLKDKLKHVFGHHHKDDAEHQ